MSFIAVAAGVTAAVGVANGISGWKDKKAAKAKNAAAKKKMEAAKDKYMNLDTSNPYLNMENTMEDLTVNQQAADFAKTASQQSEANILNNMNKAAGGSGVAALAQALANQQQIGAQKASQSIADQEAMNQKAERAETSRLQGLEREGEIQSRNLKRDQAATELKFASADVQSTAQQMSDADAKMWGGVNQIGTAVGQFAGGMPMKKNNSSLKMKSPLMSVSLNTGGGVDPVKYYQDALLAERNQKNNYSKLMSQTLSGFGAGITDFAQQERDRVKLEKEAEENRIKGYEDMLSANVDKIAENAGSLGGEYYNIAFDQAKVLQEQYLQAVKDGDKKKQGELKMALKSLSTNVGTLKEGLNIVADAKSGEDGKSTLSNGMTEKEKMIMATCTDPNNLVYQNGEFVWRNPEYDPNVEGSKEFFNQKDFSGSLVEMDMATAEEYRVHEQQFNKAGMDFANGVDGAQEFNENRIVQTNKNFINEDNIASIMHDDFRGVGDDNTFVKQIGTYLQDVNYEDLGLDPVQFDTNDDGIVNALDFELEKDREKLFKAITDKSHPLYDYETSREIVAEWMTSFQKKSFYGDTDPTLTPVAGETLNQFKGRGGSMGMLKNMGIVWDVDNNMFVNTSSFDDRAAYDKLIKEIK